MRGNPFPRTEHPPDGMMRAVMREVSTRVLVCLVAFAVAAAAAQVGLLRHDSEACEWFSSRYVDDRGCLPHTPRWGALDGPDGAY